jgi:NTE family protein
MQLTGLPHMRVANTMPEPDKILDHIACLIRQSGAFSSASDDCIRSLAEVADWTSIPGGSVLFLQGEPSSTMFIAVSGLLGAYIRNDAGEETLAGRIGPGELVGEMGCISAEPRSATIRALRTSEVLSISWELIEELARTHPVLLLSISRTVVGRLRRLQEGKPAPLRPRTFCLLPHGDEQDIRAFVDDLVKEFRVLGPTVLATKDNCGDNTADQLFALEAAHEYVIYLAESSRTPWSRLCLRQADSILVIAQGASTPRPIEPLGDVISAGIATDLVLLWPGAIIQGKTMPWLDTLRPRTHFHVRSGSDISRAARLLTNNGLGLVLSGGGARGLSHIGVGRALVDNGIPIDAVIGTSIGALIGSSIAMEWDHNISRARVHKFSRKHPLLELVIPRRSLFSGRNLRLSLEQWYSGLNIEETPIRYACVSANLNTCSATAHFRGQLQTWVRASASLPGIFPPVLEQGALHIDGGVINNLPSDIIRSMGVNFVVAVDVGFFPEQGGVPTAMEESGRAVPNIVEVLMRVGTMGSDARNLSLRQQCDILLKPDVRSVSLLNFGVYEQVIKLGYDCATAKIEQIKRRIADSHAAHLLDATDA